MTKIHHNNTKFLSLTPLLAASVLTVAMVFTATPRLAHADQFDDQISALQAQIAQNNQSVDKLKDQAGSLQSKIDAYATKIAGLQAQIDSNNAKLDDLNQQIVKAKADLVKQKTVLAAVLKSVYFQQSQTTLETLASSGSLSDYFDQQDNQARLSEQVNTTIDKINDLQDQLNKQKDIVSLLIKQQQQSQADLADAKSQVDLALQSNKSEQSSFNKKVSVAQDKIAKLQAEQAAQALAAARALNGTIVTPGTGNGGYPNAWAYAPQDTLIDSWGMYNRECVSYAAYKVAASGRHMPYWGGSGNANQWPSNARAAGIPVNSTPRVGDVAISYVGAYGHAMYVEAVNGDGTITVSQYNYDYGAGPGLYSMMTISAGGLEFIHFK